MEDQEECKDIDPFFEVIPDTQWNACIGIQGAEENYVDGYIEAALLLASTLIDKKLLGSRDTLVLPILYNARHAVELCLKFVIGRLHKAHVLTVAHPVNHDISSHWQMLKDAVIGDEALREYIDKLGPFVASLSKIDDDGQQLRYAEARDGTKSLSSHAVANLRLICLSLGQLRLIMESFKNRALDFIDEHETKSFTKECSRSDLMAIAKMLPPYEHWGEDVFTEVKNAVMAHYSLSSRKFTAAVNVIKGNREMRSIIGLESNLVYFNDENLLLALKEWCRCHPEEGVGDDLGVDFDEIDFETIVAHRYIANEVNKEIVEVLSLEQIAELIALFYMGRDRIMCEYYESEVEYWCGILRNSSNILEDVDRIMSKTSLLDQLVRALKVIGRPSLAGKVRALRPSKTILSAPVT